MIQAVWLGLLVLVVGHAAACKSQRTQSSEAGSDSLSYRQIAVESLINQFISFRPTMTGLTVKAGARRSDWARNPTLYDTCQVRAAEEDPVSDFVPSSRDVYQITDVFNDPDELASHGKNQIFLVMLCEEKRGADCQPSRIAFACIVSPGIDFASYRIARPLFSTPYPSGSDYATVFYAGARMIPADRQSEGVPYEPTDELKVEKERHLRAYLEIMVRALRSVVIFQPATKLGPVAPPRI